MPSGTRLSKYRIQVIITNFATDRYPRAVLHMFHALGSGRGIIRKILAEWVRNVRYAMRLDDIMETMFLLAINWEWEYIATLPGKNSHWTRKLWTAFISNAGCPKKTSIRLTAARNQRAN